MGKSNKHPGTPTQTFPILLHLFLAKFNCRDVLSSLLGSSCHFFPLTAATKATANVAGVNVCRQVLPFTVQHINPDMKGCTELSTGPAGYQTHPGLSQPHPQAQGQRRGRGNATWGNPTEQHSLSEAKQSLGAEEQMLAASLMKRSNIVFFPLSTGRYYCFSFIACARYIKRAGGNKKKTCVSKTAVPAY